MLLAERASAHWTVNARGGPVSSLHDTLPYSYALCRSSVTEQALLIPQHLQLVVLVAIRRGAGFVGVGRTNWEDACDVFHTTRRREYGKSVLTELYRDETIQRS